MYIIASYSQFYLMKKIKFYLIYLVGIFRQLSNKQFKIKILENIIFMKLPKSD